MLRLTEIIGNASDPDLAPRLHRLEHAGRVEYITLSRDDTLRKRLRVSTDRDTTDCAIALVRSQRLSDGSVLLLDDERAIVVRMEETPWLTVAPRDPATALELGYFAGNLHWRVRFEGTILKIALDGPEEDYLARLAPFLESGRVRRINHG